MISKKRSYNQWYVISISSIAALGGLLFGFDLGIITGVVPYIEHQFNLSGFSLGVVVAIFELGAMIGAIISARIAEKYGRKKTMIVCAILFCITSLGVAYSGGAVSLAIWRMAQGFCVGIASVLSPMYIAEVAPSMVRGKLVSMNQLTIILGILIASLVNFFFGENDLESQNWRFMLLSAIVPSAAFLGLLFLIPESPRWQLRHSENIEDANHTILKIYGSDKDTSNRELGEIKDSAEKNGTHDRVALKVLFGKAFLPIMLIGFGVAFLQQFCGANNVTPYMQKIFVMAGIKLTDGLLNAVFVQLVFFFSTFIAIALIDRIGRKVLMLAGTGIMALTLFLMAWVFQSGSNPGILVVILVMIYIGTFGFTLGPVVWVLISEMYPMKIRTRAIALTSSALWMATFIIVLVSPYLLNIGPVFNFALFGALNIVGFLFCMKYLPETKGKTLEQMNHIWKTPN